MKRRSNTSQKKKKRRDIRFFLDRNLGAIQLASQLRKAGLDITVHDDIYTQKERDPWIFYERGKNEMVVITSDKTFTKSFTHMAAIALGKTTVIFFSKHNYKSEVRGNAFLQARATILRALKNQSENFIGCVGMNGTFSIIEKKPKPMRKQCDPEDWESYRRVCEKEGIAPEEPSNEKENEANSESA